ncbi:MAG: proline--tRNA ligase, partial [Proteobacteria bacterium]|nr:proline--tRNA ligase [Pseudomonadota bacterium]
SRVAAAIIEASHDKDGIVWPVPVAPFEVALVNLKPGDADTDRVVADLERRLESAGIDVLVDDRDDRPGAKFATMDLIGIPYQLIVGPKGVKAGEVEVKERSGGARRTLAPEAAVAALVADITAKRGGV